MFRTSRSDNTELDVTKDSSGCCQKISKALAQYSLFNTFQSTYRLAYKSYYQYMTTPESALEETRFKFRHAEFITAVNNHDGKKYLNESGVCLEMLLAWHAYASLGKDFIADLHGVYEATQQKRKFDTNQLSLLKNINHIRENMRDDLIKVNLAENEFFIQKQESEISTMTRNMALIEYLTESAIQRAIENPGHLIGIYPQGLEGGHAIGIAARKREEKIIISYFDFNFRKASFIDRSAARKSIAKLLLCYTNILDNSGYFTSSDELSFLLRVTDYQFNSDKNMEKQPVSYSHARKNRF